MYGAAAASIACVELLKALGVPNQNIILIDRTGVIYKGRTENINQWKSAHAVETVHTLEEALVDADAFIGLSTGNLLNASKIKYMNKQPIIFAMANPEPEIMPDEVRRFFQMQLLLLGDQIYQIK